MSGGQDQCLPEAAGRPEPNEEGSRDWRGLNKAIAPAEMVHKFVTIYDRRQQAMGLAPGLVRSSPTDPIAEDSIEELDAVIYLKPRAAESPADGCVRSLEEDHANQDRHRTTDNSTED